MFFYSIFYVFYIYSANFHSFYSGETTYSRALLNRTGPVSPSHFNVPEWAEGKICTHGPCVHTGQLITKISC